MSNWKHAYGWCGHILTTEDGSPEDNVIKIPTLAFKSLVEDLGNCKLDPRIEGELLGVIADEEACLLATGYAFSTGFTYYGTVFEEAEMLAGGNEAVSREDQAREYLTAMKELYGLNLPSCKLMIGCSSEH